MKSFLKNNDFYIISIGAIPAAILRWEINQIIIVNLELQDDYGFNSLQLAYEIHRPVYLKAEPFVSMKKIEELLQNQ